MSLGLGCGVAHKCPTLRLQGKENTLLQQGFHNCWEIVLGRLLHRHQEDFLQKVAWSLSPRGGDGADW